MWASYCCFLLVAFTNTTLISVVCRYYLPLPAYGLLFLEGDRYIKKPLLAQDIATNTALGLHVELFLSLVIERILIVSVCNHSD